MLTKFKVENFKSIRSLELELGRVNVFIGENGSGKSNVLEAIAMGLAGIQDKLDDEFLVSRGIRLANPQLMRAAFDDKSLNHEISCQFEYGNRNINLRLHHTNEAFSSWTRIMHDSASISEAQAMHNIEDGVMTAREAETIYNEAKTSRNQLIGNFLIYFPEISSLRNFEQEGQIKPLGINGEGLFRLLKHFSEEPDQTILKEINQNLQLFGWFDNFRIPDKLWPGERSLKIKDRFFAENVDFLDQRSASEGFLFVLFYHALFISKDTPKFFAIDNVENALNPKMATKVISSMVELAKKHEKQAILTTHSPAVLDGLDLNDDEQRLFVIYRNKFGHTTAKRISKPQPLPGQTPAKLSELFMNGHLGGLPKNFSL